MPTNVTSPTSRRHDGPRSRRAAGGRRDVQAPHALMSAEHRTAGCEHPSVAKRFPAGSCSEFRHVLVYTVMCCHWWVQVGRLLKHGVQDLHAIFTFTHEYWKLNAGIVFQWLKNLEYCYKSVCLTSTTFNTFQPSFSLKYLQCRIFKSLSFAAKEKAEWKGKTFLMWTVWQICIHSGWERPRKFIKKKEYKVWCCTIKASLMKQTRQQITVYTSNSSDIIIHMYSCWSTWWMWVPIFTLPFRFGLKQRLKENLGHKLLNAPLRLPASWKLCQLCGAVQVTYSTCIRALTLKTAATWGWKWGWWQWNMGQKTKNYQLKDAKILYRADELGEV